ncbi:hypothetical protein BC938DRAFT_476002, partial [Jimgerdemannia flammicorona]
MDFKPLQKNNLHFAIMMPPKKPRIKPKANLSSADSKIKISKISVEHTAKLNALFAWFEENKVWWDKELVEIRWALPVKQIETAAHRASHMAIYARKALSEATLVCKIPKTVVLSPRSTGIANVLDDEGILGASALALAVMFELSLDIESPWYGYLQSLPWDRQDLPIFWTPEEKKWLQGTEVESAVIADLNDLNDDYLAIVAPLLAKYPYIFPEDKHITYFSLTTFVRISTLVAGRAVEVDDFHGNALVPFADIFAFPKNFEDGDESHVHMERVEEVCPACGIAGGCEHGLFGQDESEQGDNEWEDMSDNNEGEGGVHKDDRSQRDEMDIEREAFGDMDALETVPPDLDTLEAAGVNFWKADDEEDISSDLDGEAETYDICEIITHNFACTGEELLQAFEEVDAPPNVHLIGRYGYAVENNPKDVVTVDEDSVIDLCVDKLEVLMGIPKSTIMANETTGDLLERGEINEATSRVQARRQWFVEHAKLILATEDEDHGVCDDECDDECDRESQNHGAKCKHIHGRVEASDKDEEEGHDSRPYVIMYDGSFEPAMLALLHTIYAGNTTFQSFEDAKIADMYFQAVVLGTGADEEKERKRKRKRRDSKKREKEEDVYADVKRAVWETCIELIRKRMIQYDEGADGRWVASKVERIMRDKQ